MTGHGLDKTRGNADSTWPKRHVLPDGTEVIVWATNHPSAADLAEAAARRDDVARGTPLPLDDWLDEFEEGSTPQAVLDRVKRGMLLFGPGGTAEEIASAVSERWSLPDHEH